LAGFLVQIPAARRLDDGHGHLAAFTVLVPLHSHRFRFSTRPHGFYEPVLIKQSVVSKAEPSLAERAVRLV